MRLLEHAQMLGRVAPVEVLPKYPGRRLIGAGRLGLTGAPRPSNTDQPERELALYDIWNEGPRPPTTYVHQCIAN